MTKYITHVLVLLAAALAGSCTLADSQPPPLAGPSEMSLSLAITANPDVLSLDGSSQTLVTVDARDSNGQPAANVPLRVEIIANGQSIDFGSISARTLVTGSNGRVSFTYTAPAFVTGDDPGCPDRGHTNRFGRVQSHPPSGRGAAGAARRHYGVAHRQLLVPAGQSHGFFGCPLRRLSIERRAGRRRDKLRVGFWRQLERYRYHRDASVFGRGHLRRETHCHRQQRRHESERRPDDRRGWRRRADCRLHRQPCEPVGGADDLLQRHDVVCGSGA